MDQRYRARLIHLLMRRVGNAADAEDLAQQSLFRAWEKLDLYDPTRRFSSWLFTLAIRLSIDASRKPSLALASSERPEQADDAHGPVERVLQKESADNLWQLADRVLGAKRWTALWLFHGESQSAAEVGQALNMNPVAVRVLLHRARKQLREALESQNESLRQHEQASGERNTDSRVSRQLALDGAES